MWSKRKAYFILARIVRAKNRGEGVEQRKANFILARIVRAKDRGEGVEQEKG